ncbi:MAG: hypothetical protein JW800_02745 [Candidatus Omnitrophica bacterium]|nr:hypothetical protein [Candidatus Omnitrophota bacterium]
MIDSVKKAFTLGKKALKLFYVLACFNIMANLVNVMIIPAPVDAEMSLGRSMLVIIVTLLIAVAAVFITGGSIAYVRELVKTGATELTTFLENAKRYFLPLLAVSLIIIVLFLLIGIIFSVITGVMAGVLKAIVLLLMILAFIVLSVLFIMAPYMLIGRDVGVMDAIKGSLLFAKDNFLKILGIMAIMLGIALVVMIVASFFTGVLSFILKPLSRVITSIVMALVNAAMAILVNIAYMDFFLKNAEIESKK